jgi:hypothetical protein
MNESQSSIRKTVQLSEEVKAKLEPIKEKFRTKTESDAIHELIKYHAKDMIELNNSMASDFREMQSKFKFRSPTELIVFLMDFYKNVDQVPKSIFEKYVRN